eukprot:1396463-Prymnesium_polylepis.1
MADSVAEVVTVTDRGFSPERVTVRAGTRLEFRVAGTLNHLICSDDFSSPMLRPGDVWALTSLSSPGVVRY